MQCSEAALKDRDTMRNAVSILTRSALRVWNFLDICRLLCVLEGSVGVV